MLTTCKGFLDYENLDLKAYRAERLKVFVAMLGFSASPVLCRVGRNSEAHNTLRYCALPEWPLLALRRQQCLGAIFGARAAHVVPLGPVWVIQGFDQIPLERRAKAFTANERGWGTMLKVIEEYLVHAAKR